MVVEYRIRGDEDHYLTAYARYRRQLWWYRWVRLAVMLVWLALATFIYFYNSAPADWPSIGLFLFVLLGVVALTFFSPLTRVVSRRYIRKIPTLNDDWVIRLSDEGMFSSSKRGEGRLDWSGFSRARRLADGFLLFQGPNLFHWFPDSACTQPTLPSEVDDLVRRRVFDYREVGRRASSGGTRTARSSDSRDGQRNRLMPADQFAQLRDARGQTPPRPGNLALRYAYEEIV